MEKLLIVHGGGPTAVLNATLYGTVTAAAEAGIPHILGAVGGTGGILREEFFPLNRLTAAQLEQLPGTPGSAIGSSRDRLEAGDYERIIDVCRKHHINALLMNGGNGSMDTCAKLWKLGKDCGLCVIGIPKTMDNDIPLTDHSPGYGSAARYVAASTAEVCADIRGLPAHLTVIETLGRNSGWVAASAALAQDTGFAPDYIYLPEIPFDEAAFLTDCENLLKKQTGGVIVVSEGLNDGRGNLIVPPLYEDGRIKYLGDISAYLVGRIIRELGQKARSEKPGLMIRCNMAQQSAVDRREAIRVGRTAVHEALRGNSGIMIGLERQPGEDYAVKTVAIRLEDLFLSEKKVPRTFINAQGNHVTSAFTDWCRPLIGAPLPQFFRAD